MKEIIFIGDIIASQISLELATRFYRKVEVKNIISSTSHDLPLLNKSKRDLLRYNHIYYSIGYGDIINFDNIIFKGFRDRVEQDIKELLTLDKPLTFIIPLLPGDHNQETNKGYIKIYQEIYDTYDYLLENYDISFIDLREFIDISHINFQYGLTQEGLDLIIDYFLQYEFD